MPQFDKDWCFVHPTQAAAEIERLRNEQARLSAGLTALNMAPKTAPASVLRSVAYDIAFNLIDAETAEFQIKRRAGLVRADQQTPSKGDTP